MGHVTIPRISDIRRMNIVDRLSLVAKHRKYSLTEHCFNVAMLFQKFCSQMGIQCSLDDINVILLHDILETITSDLPYPVKNLSDKTKTAWKIIEEEVADGYVMATSDDSMYWFLDNSIKKVLGEEKHKLFKICDLYELFEFVSEEIEMGNKTKDMVEIQQRCIDIIDNICGKDTIKYKPILETLKNMIRAQRS